MEITVTEEMMVDWPAEAQVVVRMLLKHVTSLQSEVDRLKAMLGKNSTNSSLPPSSSHPHAKPSKQSVRKSKKKQGGQPGHPKHERALIPTHECQEVVRCVPAECRRCGLALNGVDKNPLRHQVSELPVFRLIVTEYQLECLTCACGCTTTGKLPLGVPTSQAGPRFTAFCGMLMAHYRLSKRKAALFISTILNHSASASWIVKLQKICSEAVKSTYDDLGEQLRFQKNLLIDESPTKEAKYKAWVWTMVAKTFTYFACRTTRSGAILTQLLGEAFKGVINCDRAKMYLQFQLLQWCWAHLKRDFESWAASPCPTKKRLGQDLLRQTKLMFEWMKKYRDKAIPRTEWLQRISPIREEINDLLFRGKCNGLTRNITLPIWKRREDLWRFVDLKDVEPTNNAAERSLRHAVIWRKLSFGTQSASGSRFVERMLTVIETARQRKINAFEWLTQAIQAKLNKLPCPKLQPEA